MQVESTKLCINCSHGGFLILQRKWVIHHHPVLSERRFSDLDVGKRGDIIVILISTQKALQKIVFMPLSVLRRWSGEKRVHNQTLFAGKVSLQMVKYPEMSHLEMQE